MVTDGYTEAYVWKRSKVDSAMYFIIYFINVEVRHV